MTSATLKPAQRVRDVRLDFFRGVCLVIIFIAHIVDNPWARWIPARFGFSDATEIFVFCSGMASAIAFGLTYKRLGFMTGTARVLFRCWQVYWSHIGLMLVVVASMIVVDGLLATGGSYTRTLGFDALLDARAPQAIVGALTLTWVPHYLDILPMYLVILVMIPLMVGLKQRFGVGAVVAVVLAMWSATVLGWLTLPAEPWSNYTWFFNPFGWQLVFFSGFALMAGWLPAPPIDRRVVRVAAGYLLIALPLAWAPLHTNVEVLGVARELIETLFDKSTQGPLRYLHFMALAYLAYAAAGEHGRNLSGPVVEVFRRLGQQSLAIFMTGIVLSLVASAILNVIGRTWWSVPLFNLGGIAILFAVARVTAYFKAEPWMRPAMPSPPPKHSAITSDQRSVAIGAAE